MKSKILSLLPIVGLFFISSVVHADDLCVYQRYSHLNGSIVETYRDYNCYTAERYCQEDAAAAPADPDALGYSMDCKKPDERIVSSSKTYTLYHRGVRQATFSATRYDTGYSAETSADWAASNKCSRERDRRAQASADRFDYQMNSTCTSMN